MGQTVSTIKTSPVTLKTWLKRAKRRYSNFANLNSNVDLKVASKK